MVAALIALAVLAFVALAVCSGPPAGEELARHRYQGETYTLVKYGDDLAIFSASGAPVANRNLAVDVLASYAWKRELDTFDHERLAEVSQKVRSLDKNLSDTRRFSDDVVDISDEIDSLGVDIPLIGRVSAMDVIAEAFPTVGDAESAIRELNAELNDLHENGRALAKASRLITETDPSEVSGNEISSLFVDGAIASEGLADSARTAKRSVAGVQTTVEGFEVALMEASDTPIIGDVFYEFAESVGGLSAELSALASGLEYFETELDALEEQLRDAPESAQEARQENLKSWLAKPHDERWPPDEPTR